MFVAAIPLILVLWLRWVLVRWEGEDQVVSVPRWLTGAGVALLVAFTVARNLPGSWLAP